AKPGFTQVTGIPKCEISTYYMKYTTVGGANEPTDATGAIMVPSGSDPACTGPRPVLLYAHSTTVDKSFNMANLRDNQEATMVAAMYAAQGFIVVASNYAGYDVSSLPYHPYLNAEQQANDMVDSLRAARKAFPNIGAKDNGKLVLAGYSQGGHVAMATQRAMQTTYASEFKVTALAGMSGSYATSLFVDAIFAGAPIVGGTLFAPLATTGMQKSYGGLYANTNEIYEDKYAAGIDSLLPGNLTSTELFATGKLPSTVMFANNSGPVVPGFEAFFGDGNLIKSSYRGAYLVDAQQHPCNLNLNPADPLNCAPAHPLRKAALKNDLRNYVPNVPVMLCGGKNDPTVFFAANTTSTAGFFQLKGLPAAALTVLDVDSDPSSAADPFAAAKVGFGLTKKSIVDAAVAAGKNPAVAVASVYHGAVMPFCSAASRGFFQQVLAK
ncbi:MAG: prolyl oligopeptidase family serine peptidase, partial [Burkholderiales bacterium]|nr:prolyl oligopeptidase family serine peptidase [Burkholderiales bacterium]